MNEKLQILQMLHEGTISVDEASRLLANEAFAAVAHADPAQGNADQGMAPVPEGTEVFPFPRDLGRFRRLSYIPLVVSLIALILSGWGAYALYLRADGAITPGFVVLVILFALAFLFTALALWATTVPWLHLRIRGTPGEDSAGTRLALSLPLPLTLARWGLRIARRFVDREAMEHVDDAAALIATMRQDLGKPGADPIVVDINDEDERVQVYIG